MTDIDTRVDAYLEQQVEDAVEEALEDALCVMCDVLATAALVTEPCAHRHPLCTPHRAVNARLYAFRVSTGIPNMCGLCNVEVLEIRWEQP